MSTHPPFAGAILGDVDRGRGVASPAGLRGFLVDDAFSPPPPQSAVRTTKEVLDKLVDGDFVPIDLL